MYKGAHLAGGILSRGHILTGEVGQYNGAARDVSNWHLEMTYDWEKGRNAWAGRKFAMA